jgi:transcriptional regulator GlxA family with amidase domain
MPPETINLIVTQDFNITTTMAFVDPFRVANYINGAPLYRWEFLSELGGHLRSSNGANHTVSSGCRCRWIAGVLRTFRGYISRMVG